MPCRWSNAGLAGYRGSAKFVRKFGYPGNADPATEHVWLTCDGLSGCVEIRLNTQRLTDAPCDTFAFDVTHQLAARNRLEVTIQGDDDTAGLWGDVALEIRKDAYLAEMRVERFGTRIRLSGLAIGAAPQPLELYVLVDDRNREYRTIAPAPAGEPFRFELDEIAESARSVRIDLIHVSSIWYAVQLPIPAWTPE